VSRGLERFDERAWLAEVGDAALVAEHLSGCDRCHGLAAELADVNGSIRGLLAPLAVAGTAAGYASSAVGVASLGVAASGAAVGAAALPSAAATGANSVLGSALGWLLGTQGAQVAAAVFTAVVVDGTAVATGATGTGPGERGPTTAAVAAASSDGTGTARARIHSVRLILRQSVGAKTDKPSTSKRSIGKPSNGWPSNGKPSNGKPSNGKPLNGKPSREPAAEEPSKDGASLARVTSASSAPSLDKSALTKVKGEPTSANATHAESSKVPSAQGGAPGRVGR
jgi:hypothetical protein